MSGKHRRRLAQNSAAAGAKAIPRPEARSFYRSGSFGLRQRRVRRPDLFIVRATKNFISISPFFDELKREFKAPGDFAQAYVIAHEVGHHVQNILGTMEKVNQAGNSNELSVRLELQADCYAGVWAYYAQKQGLVEAGDVEEAIRAASVGRRRRDSETLAGLRRSRFVYARLFKRENGLVHARLSDRRYAPVRHFQQIV